MNAAIVIAPIPPKNPGAPMLPRLKELRIRQKFGKDQEVMAFVRDDSIVR